MSAEKRNHPGELCRLDVNAPGDEGLYARMRRCGHYLFHRSEGKFSQLRILTLIADRGGEISQRELMEILAVRSASVSEILAKVEAQGYVERRRSEADRRNMDVFLLEKGREAVRAGMLQREEMIREAFSGLTAEEKKELSLLLGKLLDDWCA